MKLELTEKKALVLGLGATGLSMARWLARQGARVRVADSRSSPPCAPQLAHEHPTIPVAAGPFQRSSFENLDLIAISPGVPLAEPLVQEVIRAGVPVVGDVELFAQALDTVTAAKVVGITGSNGKSTVTEMTGAMCRAAGLRTCVAGNIGLPVLDALQAALRQPKTARPEIFVLELSSFQLETTCSLDLFAAVVLNVTEDHLDRYDGMEQYAAAKARVFQGSGVQVLNRQDLWSRGMAIQGRRVLTFGLDHPGGERDWGLIEQAGETWLAQDQRTLMPVSALRVFGLHNAANALAALALCRAIDLPYEPLLEALRQFEGLPHRVQKVAEVAGVGFYDDSKGTNVGATVAALTGMRQPVVLIAGGDGKGQDFTPLKPAVAGRARAVILIGRDRERIAAAISGSGVPLKHARDMDEAVQLGFESSREGDAVLLSPACASFDMFRNYEHRAQVFVRAVRQLEARR